MASHGENSTTSSTASARTPLDLMEKKSYNPSSEDHTGLVVAELLSGKGLAKQLHLLLSRYHHHPVMNPPTTRSSSETDSVITTTLDDNRCHEQQQPSTKEVTQKILESYESALSLLGQYRLGSGTPPTGTAAADGGDCKITAASSSTFKIPAVKRGSYKRRVSKPTWQVEVENGFDDGFSWRKYGQKESLGGKYPRSYFRCANKYIYGCNAIKKVQQMSDKTPPSFKVIYNGRHTCLRTQEAAPSSASGVTTCVEESPLFFDPEAEFGEVEDASAGHHNILHRRKSSSFFNLNQNPQQSEPAADGLVHALPNSCSSASYVKTRKQKDAAMFKLDSEISRCEEPLVRSELYFPGFLPSDFDNYDINGNRNDELSGKATDLNLDLGLGLGTRMSSAMPTDLKASMGFGLSLDLGIGTPSAPDYGMAQSLQSQVISCSQLQDDKKKVSDRILDVAESIHVEVKKYAASFEFKPSHGNSMIDTQEQLYISKSPSLKFCSAHIFVSLFFSFCKLPQLWNGVKQLLVSLKHLDANHSDLLWIPDLSKAQKLESLNLEGCENLVGISSIQYLTKLQHLNLKGCQSLKRIPSLIRLKLLKTFDLSDCSNLTRLPPSLGCLPNLSELNLKNCAKLANLPRSVMHLMKSLENLNISGCSSMWKLIGDDDDGAVPLSTKPHLGFSVMPFSEETHQENLPNSNSYTPANEDSSLESQLNTAEQVDVVAEGSPSQDLSLDLEDIRGKKAIEPKEEAFLRIPLISSLLSELRSALLFPPNVGSSHDIINIQTINHTENNKSEAEESEIATLLQMEEQQQLCNDDGHDDAKADEKKPPSAETEPIFCQVEDCQVDLTGAETYHQQHKICEIHCMATAAILGNILQRFCQQCCRFHVLGDFDEEERNCRSRLAGYHQKQRRQSSAATIGTEEEHSSPETTDLDAETNIAESEDENEKCLLHKRIRTVDPPEQNQPTQAVKPQPFNDWDEANAIGDIEDRVLEMIEQISRSNYAHDDDKAAAAVPESVLAWLAEMEQSVPETVRSMKRAKAKAAADTEEWKVADARLVIGELELRLLDMELTRISEEEEEIEAELQRLMDKKREMPQQQQH